MDTRRFLTRLEHSVAVLIMLYAIGLHARVLAYSGPLWRDEINGLNVARMSTVGQLWRSIVYYPFPIVHDMVLRCWIALGFGANDFQLRVLAFLLGILLVGAIWIGALFLDREKRAPLLPLALFALNPVVIQNGDWLRPYALAMIFVILTFVFVWRLTFAKCGTGTVLAAILAAVLCVQTVFLNAVLVFAICVAAMSVLVWAKRWGRAACALLVGLIAALSLGPYLPALRDARSWSAIVRIDRTPAQIARAGIGALSNHNAAVALLWLIPLLVVIAEMFVPFWKRDAADDDAGPNRRIAFGFIALTIATAGTIAFLSVAGWLMDRYFVPGIAVVTLCAYVLAKTFRKALVVRLINLLVCLTVAGLMVWPAWKTSATRATNCDLIAARLSRDADDTDLIVLTSFTYGIAFSRYYHGEAKWRSIPEVQDHSQHRWDQVLETMKQPNPMRETRAEIEATLKAGHKVFIVGALPASDQPSTARAGNIWTEEALRNEIGKFLREHVASGEQLPVANESEIINPLENLPLFLASGWRETSGGADLAPNER